MASSQEVSYTRRDRLCPPLGARPLGPALWYRTLWMMATCMPASRIPRPPSRIPRPPSHIPLRNICAEKLALRCGIVVHATVGIDPAE